MVSYGSHMAMSGLMQCPLFSKKKLTFVSTPHPSPLFIIPYPFSLIHSPLSIIHYPFSIIHSPLSIPHYPFSLIHSPFSLLPSPFSILHSPFSLTLSPLSIIHYLSPFSCIASRRSNHRSSRSKSKIPVLLSRPGWMTNPVHVGN